DGRGSAGMARGGRAGPDGIRRGVAVGDEESTDGPGSGQADRGHGRLEAPSEAAVHRVRWYRTLGRSPRAEPFPWVSLAPGPPPLGRMRLPPEVDRVVPIE